MKRWTYPLLAGLAVLAVAGCSDDTTASSATATPTVTQSALTFTIDSGVVGQTDNVGTASCEFFDGWLREGDPVIVRGADNALLGKSELVFESVSDNPEGVPEVCIFSFTMENVKAGEPA